ncbi:putative quinol monooxygenase [Microvirga subterranea]|uniref:Quinol monooxygenase YgiN n=1 Tax=Microvirga subterranea TaxID=186651 RepID=A0A370HJA2_9HYPH|nr:putative quinol monooxygenase [Microvirga subterranea]RDI58609.1 quinol monooxygenase YgiN [Microvirga subterranea]
MKHRADFHRDEKSRGPAKDVTFIVTVALKPGCEEEFFGLLTPVLDAMRHEPTFINAVLHQDPEDPSRFMLYETWADLDDVVQVQMHRTYRKPFWDRLPDLLREPRRIETWTPMRRDFTFFASW